MFSLLFSPRTASKARLPASPRIVRVVAAPRPTMVENLERRELLSASVAQVPVSLAAAPAAVTQPLASASKLAQKGVTSVLPLKITSVIANAANGTLTAIGSIGSTVFSIPLTLVPGTSANNTPILDLHVGAIHLDLLGLQVDTSEICLSIGAQSGPGNLLGNLLTGVANLLNGGFSLGDVLGGLNPAQLGTLTQGLTDLLNGGLGRILAPSSVTGTGSSVAGGSTNILHLALGPIDLDLLGLTVNLDNCHNGPVTVDITAKAGPGNLLGNLLTGLTRLLDGPASNVAVANALARVVSAIPSLI